MTAIASYSAMGNQDGLRAAWVTREDGTTENLTRSETLTDDIAMAERQIEHVGRTLDDPGTEYVADEALLEAELDSDDTKVICHLLENGIRLEGWASRVVERELFWDGGDVEFDVEADAQINGVAFVTDLSHSGVELLRRVFEPDDVFFVKPGDDITIRHHGCRP